MRSRSRRYKLEEVFTDSVVMKGLLTVFRLALASAGLAQHDGFMFWLCVMCVMWPTSFLAFFGMRAFPSSTPSPPCTSTSCWHLIGPLVAWFFGSGSGFWVYTYCIYIDNSFPRGFCFCDHENNRFCIFFSFLCNVISRNTVGFF